MNNSWATLDIHHNVQGLVPGGNDGNDAFGGNDLHKLHQQPQAGLQVCHHHHHQGHHWPAGLQVGHHASHVLQFVLDVRLTFFATKLWSFLMMMIVMMMITMPTILLKWKWLKEPAKLLRDSRHQLGPSSLSLYRPEPRDNTTMREITITNLDDNNTMRKITITNQEITIHWGK